MSFFKPQMSFRDAGRPVHWPALLTLCMLLSQNGWGADKVSLRYVEGSGGVPINVAESGPSGGLGVLFIHGNGQSYLSWERQLTSDLAMDYHLVAMDLRGHGNSGKPWDSAAYASACIWAEDVDAVVRATGLEKFVLVGWSRGGLIAMHYIQCKGTENIAGVMLVSSRAQLVPATMPDAESPARFSQELLESNDFKDNLRGALMFAERMTAEPRDPGWLQIATAMNLQSPPYARRAMRVRTVDQHGDAIKDYSHLAQSIDVPVTIILGGKDPIRSTPEMKAAFTAAMPSADVIVYPDSGHSPFAEETERFNKDLRLFVIKSASAAVPNR